MRRATNSDLLKISNRSRVGYPELAKRLALPSLGLIAVEALLVLLDPRVMNVHLLLASLGLLQLVASAVHARRPVAVALHAVALVSSVLSIGLALARSLNTTLDAERRDAGLYALFSGLLIIQQVYGWWSTKRGKRYVQ